MLLQNRRVFVNSFQYWTIQHLNDQGSFQKVVVNKKKEDQTNYSEQWLPNC